MAPKRKWLLERRVCSAFTTQASKTHRPVSVPQRCTLLSCTGSGVSSKSNLRRSLIPPNECRNSLTFDGGNGRQSHPRSPSTAVISLQVAAIPICCGRRNRLGMVRRVHLRSVQHFAGGEHDQTKDWIYGGGGRDFGDEPGTRDGEQGAGAGGSAARVEGSQGGRGTAWAAAGD